MKDEQKGLGRREVLAGASVAAAAAAVSSTASAAPVRQRWDQETDVICVGSGAAAGTAAVTALSQGAKVMMIEKMPMTGGTTSKSGGVAWIPNNPILRANGIDDRKNDCLRYMARYAFPNEYTPNSPTLGLPELQYRLIEAFYDNASPAIEHLEKVGAVKFKQFMMWQVNRQPPDYADHLPENKVPKGRALEPADGPGVADGGYSLAAQLEQWVRSNGGTVVLDTRVTRLIKDGDRVIGVEAQQGEKTLRIRARRAVVFGTGGFSHNEELCKLHQPSLYGSCSMPSATGDFIDIATEAGARMGSLNTAWRTQIVLEEALESRAVGLGVFVLPGDSMIVVNKYGNRCVNEKRDYNDRTRAHFTFDPTKEEYPNHLMFMIFDERTIDAFGGSFPLPVDKREARFLVEAPTLDELSTKLSQRLATIADKTGRVELAPEFGRNLRASVQRFNGYAKAGEDPEFGRGLHEYDREWHPLFSWRREGTKYPVNPMPNITMHPIADKGPYYAFILGAGTLDTNAGPLINEKGQVLGRDNKPIGGLYGAGNCVASPARNAYFAAGGTIGLAIAYGYIAALNAVKETATV